MRHGRPSTRGGASQGFTLIEVLIVVAIIAILIVLALPSLQKSRTGAYEASAVAGLHTMDSAFELYYRDHGFYPPMDSTFTINYFPEIQGYLPPETYIGGTSDVIAKGYQIRAKTTPFAGAGTSSSGQIVGSHIFTIGAFPINPELHLRTFFIEPAGTVTVGDPFNNF